MTTRRQEFFEKLKLEDHVGLYLRVCPNPIGDRLLLPKNNLMFKPEEVLEKQEIEKIYGDKLNIKEYPILFQKDIILYSSPRGDKYEFKKGETKFPYIQT